MCHEVCDVCLVTLVSHVSVLCSCVRMYTWCVCVVVFVACRVRNVCNLSSLLVMCVCLGICECCVFSVCNCDLGVAVFEW